MEEDLVARLLANTALVALVGDRINWIDRPEGDALPSVTLQVITSGDAYTYEGRVRFVNSRVQTDCWGRSYLEAKLVSRALRDAIEPPATIGSTSFGQSFRENAPDFPPEDIAGGVTAYRVNGDFIIWHRPA